MSRWTVEFSRAGRKDFDAIRDVTLAKRVRAAIFSLSEDARPPGCRKLEGRENEWRVRVGTWRVIYRIEDVRLVVVVVEIGPRGDVYW
jgi:mRNA interferase RelE/StbE